MAFLLARNRLLLIWIASLRHLAKEPRHSFQVRRRVFFASDRDVGERVGRGFLFVRDVQLWYSENGGDRHD